MELVDDELVPPGEGKKPMDKSPAKKRKKKPKQTPEKKPKPFVDDEPMETDVKETDNSEWSLKTVTGADLITRRPSVTPCGRQVVVVSGEQVLVYSAAAGSLVRTLNTGPALAAAAATTVGHVFVASKKKICLWNFHEVKIVKQLPFLSKEGKAEFVTSDVEDVFIPSNFEQLGVAFVTVKVAGKFVLYRVNTSNHSVHRIFKNIKLGSVDVGDGGNSVCAISCTNDGSNRDAVLLLYDQNLSKVVTVRTDRERPYTVARVHPGERAVAAGDASGRVLVYSGLEQQEPIKAILHWHSLPVAGLAWSAEGATLYSGGGEAALCKWRREDGGKPQVVPRLEAPVVGLAGGGGLTVLQLANNSLVLLDRAEDRVRGVVGGLARSESGYPAGLAADRERILLNGTVGKVQVWAARSGRTYSIDITGQNYLAKERGAAPHNSEVERLAVAEGGGVLATLDCQWSAVPRTTLRLWTFDPTVDNYTLNTQVDSPHLSSVRHLSFQPSAASPLLLSVGSDRRAKLWARRGVSWTCVSALQLRGLAAEAGGWSDDGTLLAVSFGHLVTLWDTASRLRSSLAVEGATETVTSLAFGRGPSARLLFAATAGRLTTWDLVTLAPAWSLALAPSLHCTLAPCPTASLLALVQKQTVQLLCTSTGAVQHTVEEANCTGGAAWLADPRSPAASALHFLTYCGQLRRLGAPRPSAANTPLQAAPSHLGSLLATAGVRGAMPQPRQWTRAGRGDDMDAVLALPLHTLPAPSQLRGALVRGRLLALPRLRTAPPSSLPTSHADPRTNKTLQKLEQVLQFEEQAREELSLKAFCKLLKSTE